MANTNTNTTTNAFVLFEDSGFPLKLNVSKYDNLHKCDQAYWKLSLPYDKLAELTKDEVFAAYKAIVAKLDAIAKCEAFKADNRDAAAKLLKVATDFGKQAEGLTTDVQAFCVYQLERYMLRIWHRDTRAARDALTPKAPAKQEKKAEAKKAPAKQEKKPAAKAKKAPAKQEKKPAAKKAPAKQDIAKTNEALFVSKLTKEQKTDILLTLLADLLG